MTIVMAYIETINGYVSRRKASIERVLVIDRREMTLNNKFSIPGIDTQRYNVDPLEETEALPEPDETDTQDEDTEYEMAEVLELPQTEFETPLKGVQIPALQKQSLISRITTASNF